MGGGLAVAIMRENKQGVIVVSAAQTVTAGMVSVLMASRRVIAGA